MATHTGPGSKTSWHTPSFPRLSRWFPHPVPWPHVASTGPPSALQVSITASSQHRPASVHGSAGLAPGLPRHPPALLCPQQDVCPYSAFWILPELQASAPWKVTMWEPEGTLFGNAVTFGGSRSFL